MLWLWFLTIFFLGSAVGSFVNVLISRTVAGKDWVRGRSICDHCKKPLAWYDMVPIFSYLAYRGRSRCCHRPLTLRHPLVEALMGSLFLWWAGMGVFFFQLATRPLSIIQPLFWLVVGVVLMILALADAFYGVVLMPLVWLATGWIVLYRIVLLATGAYHSADFILALAAAAGAAFFIWLLRALTRGKGMGDGDIYLAVLVGLLTGWPRVIIGIFSAFIMGATVGAVMLLTGAKKRGDTLPFGPFLMAGIVVALVWGQAIWAQFFPL